MSHYKIWWVGKDFENNKILEWSEASYGEHEELLNIGYDYFNEYEGLTLLDKSKTSVAEKKFIHKDTPIPSDILIERRFPDEDWVLTKRNSGTTRGSDVNYDYETLEEALSFVNDDECIVCLDVHL